jgi:hypothetical protein
LLSSWLLAGGLIAGLALNLVKRQEGMPWTDPVVWISGLLFIWLLIVLLFESLYRPVQQGRKVVYLTLASFIFLALVIGLVLLAPSQHASPLAPQYAATAVGADVGRNHGRQAGNGPATRALQNGIRPLPALRNWLATATPSVGNAGGGAR